MKPRVNVAVCGDFKQLQYVPDLARRFDVGGVYFAGRLSHTAASLGVEPGRAVNAFFKEYLVQAHARYLNGAASHLFYNLYDALWRSKTMRRWTPCDVLFAVIQGKAPDILARARRETCLGMSERLGEAKAQVNGFKARPRAMSSCRRVPCGSTAAAAAPEPALGAAELHPTSLKPPGSS